MGKQNARKSLVLTQFNFFCIVPSYYSSMCLLRLGVRTAGFHPANRGSNPLGDA